MMRTLEYLRGIAPEECRRLRRAGIRNTLQMLHATSLIADRRTLSGRTGIPEPRLLELCRQCQMLEISGMTAHLPVVRRLGITSVDDLRRQSAEDLHQQLVAALGMAGAPRLTEVEYWISQARAVDIIEADRAAEQEESPSVMAGTPESRRTAV